MKVPPIRRRPESGAEGGLGWPRLRDRMDRLFQSVFAEPFGLREGAWAPDVDVREGEGDIEVVAELPGMDPGEIQLSAQGRTLTISGEKREEREEERRDYYFREIHRGSFQRVVELPEDADPERIEAEYARGVLRVRIAKKEGAAPKRIAVKGAPDIPPG